MVEPWILLTAGALSCFTGYVCLALAMTPHWQQVTGTKNAPKKQVIYTLRLSGVLGLAVSAILCFIADRPSMAVLVWLMLLAAMAPLVGMLLAYKPAWLGWVLPKAWRGLGSVN